VLAARPQSTYSRVSTAKTATLNVLVHTHAHDRAHALIRDASHELANALGATHLLSSIISSAFHLATAAVTCCRILSRALRLD
jgi:hypothetical protein